MLVFSTFLTYSHSTLHETYSSRFLSFFFAGKDQILSQYKMFYDVATRCLFIRLDVLTQSDTITDSEEI